MRRLAMLLVFAVAAGVSAEIMAGTTDPVGNADSAAPASRGSRLPSSVPASYSFADIVNLRAGTEPFRLSDGALERISDGTLSELSRINHSAPARTGVISTLNGAFEDLSGHSSVAPAAGSNSGAGILFPTEGIPDPSGWMLLLCGLLVAGFMARRRRAPPPD